MSTREAIVLVDRGTDSVTSLCLAAGTVGAFLAVLAVVAVIGAIVAG